MRRSWLCPSVMLALTCCGCNVELIHEVEEGTANEIVAALHRYGVAADKVRDAQGSKVSYAVAVARGDAAQAWMVLRRENLPRPVVRGLGEVFGQTTLVPTATQEGALMHHALAGELSRTLQSVRGVLDARVHVVLPTREPLALPDSPASPPKASVLLRVGKESPLSVEEVQRLVAGSVKDLSPQAVAVLVVHDQELGALSASLSPAAAWASVGPFHVAPKTRAPLLATCVVGLLVIVALGLGTLVVLRRNRILVAQLARAPEHQLAAGSAARLASSLGLVERSLATRGSRASAARKDSF